jgi:hypothetical protein
MEEHRLPKLSWAWLSEELTEVGEGGGGEDSEEKTLQ